MKQRVIPVKTPKIGLMKRIIAASSALGVVGTIALFVTGLTLSPQAVAAGNRGEAAEVSASTEQEGVQAYIAPRSMQDAELEYASDYSTDTLTGMALDLRSFLKSSLASADSGPAEGGLTLEQAQLFMADYVSTDQTGALRKGEAVLQALYGDGSGPGNCGGRGAVNMLDNCVGFVTYFMNMYTSFDQYVVANGGQEAVRMAAMLQRDTSSTPSVYSIGSDPSTSYYGHTFVVLGIHDGKAIIGEAACGLGASAGWPRARAVPLSELSGDTFVNVSDLVLDEPRTLAELLAGK